MVTIAFTGGGTGGHIFPGLAIVAFIKKISIAKGVSLRLIWIGSNKGMDRSIVERAGMEFFGIPSGKLRRYFSVQNITDIFKVLAGFFAALRVLKREKPALLFSKGGFVSVPPCAASALLKIPVFAHESDFSPGLATRINSRFAEKIFIPYKESARLYRDRRGRGGAEEKIYVSGNPIREEFAGADPKKGRAFLGLGEDERILLVLGGSLGSRELNDLVRLTLPELTRYYTVVHQSGGGEKADPNNGVERYLCYPFFREELPHIIAAAELVLCRSGASTIWECKSLNKPMILVPLRGSGTRGDQVENARLFEEAGAAVCLSGGHSSEDLSGLVASLAGDGNRRKAMGEAKIGRIMQSEIHAAEFIAEEIMHRIGGDNG